jgi:hypothetical protein
MGYMQDVHPWLGVLLQELGDDKGLRGRSRARRLVFPEEHAPPFSTQGVAVFEASVGAICDYIRLYKRNPRPFQWVASASKIIRRSEGIKRV